MPEHRREGGTGYELLRKALLLEALDSLEQEFFAFQKRHGGAHTPATTTVTLIDADVKRTQELLLTLES